MWNVWEHFSFYIRKSKWKIDFYLFFSDFVGFWRLLANVSIFTVSFFRLGGFFRVGEYSGGLGGECPCPPCQGMVEESTTHNSPCPVSKAHYLTHLHHLRALFFHISTTGDPLPSLIAFRSIIPFPLTFLRFRPLEGFTASWFPINAWINVMCIYYLHASRFW